MGDRDYSEVTWEEYQAEGAKRPSRGARLNAKEETLTAKGLFRIGIDEGDPSVDSVQLFDDVYPFPKGFFGSGGISGYRSQVFERMWWRQLVLDDGGTPADFEDGKESA